MIFRVLFLQSLILLVRAVGTGGDWFVLQFCRHHVVSGLVFVLWGLGFFVYSPLLCSHSIMLQLHKEVR